jgi:hypothetical protein
MEPVMGARGSGRRDASVIRQGPEDRSLSFRVQAPDSRYDYRLCWQLLAARSTPVKVRKALPLIRSWQGYLLERHRQGETSLDDACQEIAQALAEGLLPGSHEVSLFVGDISDLEPVPPGMPGKGARHPGAALRLVGSNFALTAPLSTYALPFGAGVVGRAFRSGQTVLYDRFLAETTREQFQNGETSAVPRNYLYPLVDGREFTALLAAPIVSQVLPLPPEQRKEARYVLAVLCIGARGPQSGLLAWEEHELAQLTAAVLTPLEEKIYTWAQELAAQRGSIQ